MLSPGSYHLTVPRDPVANAEWRLGLHKLVEDGGEPAAEAIRFACKNDLLFFVNAFGVQVNPNPWDGAQEVGPFCTWGFQDDFLTYGSKPRTDPATGAVTTGSPGILSAVEGRHPLVVPKSREVGASWLFIFAADWLCRFHCNKTVYFLSRNEEAVDSNDKGSLFPKLRFIQRHLPEWLTPEAESKSMYAGYPWTDSEIAGGAATKAAKVGGRATVMFFDEYSRFAEQRPGADHAVLKATKDVSRCRVFVSTHTEVGTAFEQLTKREDYPQHVLHWSQHPVKGRGLYRYDPTSDATGGIVRYDDHQFPEDYSFVTDGSPFGGPFPGLRSPWYDRECVERGDQRDISMNLDVDVAGATKQFFDTHLLMRLRDTDAKVAPMWVGAMEATGEGRLKQLFEQPGGYLRLWFEPDADQRPPRMRVAIGSDISWGQGASPSCMVGFNATTGAQVFEFAHARFRPWQFAPLFAALGWWFKDADDNPAWLIWEVSGPSGDVSRKLLEWEYPNLYYRVDDTYEPPRQSEKPGWAPGTHGAKSRLLSAMHSAMSRGQCQIRSKGVIEECQAFKHDGKGGVEHPRQRTNDDPSGANEAHADLAMAAALGWRMVEDMGLGRLARSEERRERDRALDPSTLAGRRALAKVSADLPDWY